MIDNREPDSDKAIANFRRQVVRLIEYTQQVQLRLVAMQNELEAEMRRRESKGERSPPFPRRLFHCKKSVASNQLRGSRK